MAILSELRTSRLLRLVTTFFIIPQPFLTCGVRITSNRAGPYRVAIRQITNCTTKDVSSSSENFVDLKFTPPKAGQPQYAWGRCINNDPITDTQQLAVSLDRRINDGWKKGVFIFRFNNACSASHRLSPAVIKVLFDKDGEKCPMSAGHRIVRNQTAIMTFPEIPIFPYGHWQATIKLMESGKSIGCFSADADVIPKKLGADF